MKKFAPRAAVPVLAAVVSLAPMSAGAASIPGLGSPAPAEDRAAAPTTDAFNVATFNVLGGGHTRGRGGMRSGAARMKGTISLMRKHHVTLAGFQELEGRQATAFRKRTKGKWGLVGAPSRSGRTTDNRNAIAFYKRDFSLLKKTSIAITYFHGNRVNIPLLKLRSKTNGKAFWILNTHNPADVHGSAAKWRAESVRRELKQIHRLRSKGQTVLFTGDMNGKQDFFCRATRSGSCTPPPAGRRARSAATRAGTASTGCSAPATCGSRSGVRTPAPAAAASPTTRSSSPAPPSPADRPSRLGRLEQVRLVGQHDRLRPVAQVELLQQPGDVGLDGGVADEQLAADLGVGQPRVISRNTSISRRSGSSTAAGGGSRLQAGELPDHAPGDGR